MSKQASRMWIRGAGLSGLLLIFSLNACTDLTESPVSAITPENFYQTEEEVLGGLASVYAELRNTLNAYYNVSQVSSDETIVPTRGQDWYDNGRWLELHYQNWGANSPAGLDDIGGVWVNLFTGIARANVVLQALENVTVANQSVVEAELKTLRAFYYYLLMDMFGGVPIVAYREDDPTATDIEIKPRARNTRAEVFRFIESELDDTRLVLPDQWPSNHHGRMTRGAANAILASMYLNAGIFTKDDGVSVSDYNSCQGVQVSDGGNACQAAVAAADRILNSGAYSLAANWRSNFMADNTNSPENILVVKHLNQDGLGMNFLMRSLHYHQLNSGPWNGFATLAETYNAFDPDDSRTEIMLVGCQVNLETGEPVDDRAGQPLCFTPEIGDETQAAEHEGVRVAKWTYDPNYVGGDHSNDFTYFRLAEIYLIKAEALNELGQTGEAVDLVNVLRERVFDPPKPIPTMTQTAFRAAVLDERLFELTTEAKRRQDLIRHGEFTRPWFAKSQREPHRVLMPIPQTQLDTNPLLTQNPGY